ncbi:MAG: transketolase family protein [Chloroflexi bacterium]|nr:transketolase family protein [Chloroflexota bacterium]MYD49602.1 transketolase family protein [Chloroflexota bacterium]
MTTTRQSVATRETYGRTLLTMAEEHPDIVVLGGDLNVSTFVHLWRDQYPDRFFDFGPAEQNIVGVAAGLAAAGKIPFVSTFSVFGTGRPYDQLRVLISQPSLNVKLVCTHAGILTGEDGMSAHSIEDLSLMCALPSFSVTIPTDAPETEQVIRAAAVTRGPQYVRLPRAATPVVHSDGYQFHPGKAEIMRAGGDVSIIACGSLLAPALDAADSLAGQSIDARVINLHTLAPADENAIIAAAEETGAIVTAEEHYVHGGLGSVVAGVVARNRPVPVEMVALHGYTSSGPANELMVKNGLTSDGVAEAVHRVLKRK